MSNGIKKTLKRSVIFSTIKQVCALIFPLITIPYITRTIGSASYGRYNFAVSIVSYFAYIAAFGISTYGIRECSKVRDNENSLNKKFSELLNINLLFTFVSYILLIGAILLTPKLQDYSALILIYSISIGLTTIGADWINVVFEEYEYITIRYIVIQVISLLLMITFVKSPEDVGIYCAISVLAGAGGNIANIGYIRKRVKYKITSGFNFSVHIHSLLIFFISSLGILIYVNSDVTMLGFFLDDADVGVYGFCSKLYGVMKTVVYSIVSTSAARIAYLVKTDTKQYLRYMDRIFTTLILILFPLCAGGIGLRSSIINIVGGLEYASGTSTLSVLIVTLPFAIMCSYFSSLILIVNNKERIMLISTIISATSNILLNLWFIPHFGVIGAAITTFIAEFISFVIAFVSARKFYDYRNINVKTFIPVGIECLIIAFLCVAVNLLIKGTSVFQDVIKVAICMGMAGFSYIVIILNSQNESVKGLVNPILAKIGIRR